MPSPNAQLEEIKENELEIVYRDCQWLELPIEF
jgi:hypothetical protein